MTDISQIRSLGRPSTQDSEVAAPDTVQEAGKPVALQSPKIGALAAAVPLRCSAPTAQAAAPTPTTSEDAIAPEYMERVPVRRVEGASLVVGRRDSLNSWGYEGNRHHIANAVLGDLAIEIDATKMKDGVRNTAKGTPYATAHNDGFGGAGDGRALVMAEREGRVLNMKGIGITPYVIQDFAIRLGFHALGGVDGRASLKEGIRTLATGDMLEVLGIPGERLAALIDNGGSASGGGETGRSAIIAREYPGAGIRNSHFRVWKDDPEQVGRGMAVLRELASKELGKPVSNRELVELEAR
ncbi:MAG: protein adenylyltransferase SelO family protein, partial [Myxococcota bacterium]